MYIASSCFSPDVSLADASARRDEARKLLANGVDPTEI